MTIRGMDLNNEPICALLEYNRCMGIEYTINDGKIVGERPTFDQEPNPEQKK